jgi:transcriptional regulator with XRE-family HTH domain
MEATDREIHRVLGRHIRELRLKGGFSQESFADHCGLHRTYMGAIERGERNLTLQTLLTVSKGLGLTLSQLLSGLEKKTKASAS